MQEFAASLRESNLVAREIYEESIRKFSIAIYNMALILGPSHFFFFGGVIDLLGDQLISDTENEFDRIRSRNLKGSYCFARSSFRSTEGAAQAAAALVPYFSNQ